MEQNKHTNLGKSPEEIQAIRKELAKLLSMSDTELSQVDLSQPIGITKTASAGVPIAGTIEPEEDVEMLDPDGDDEFKKIMEERRAAAAKAAASPSKRIKGRTTVMVKEATAFGTVNKEVEVERELGKNTELSPEEAKKAKDTALEEQMKEILAEKGVQTDDTKIAAAKDLREKLAGLWSDDISKTSSADDSYIEGLPSDGPGGVRNHDAGSNGIRISFKGKNK